jgi:hypothetical protein
LPIATAKIQGGEDGTTGHAVMNVLNERKRIMIGNEMLIESAIIDAEAQITILLLNQNDRRRDGRRRRSDNPRLKHGGQQLNERLLLGFSEMVGIAVYRHIFPKR